MEGLTRKLMPLMLLIMLGGLYWLWSNDLLTHQLAIGLGISYLICTIIFYHFVYVFNYGYACSMIVIPTLYALLYSPALPGISVLVVAFLYGVRLLTFTWHRYHSASYADRATNARATSKAIPFFVKIITWLFTGSLIFYVTFNAWVVASSAKVNNAIWIAITTMLLGLFLESLADRQKQRAKQKNKGAACRTGLYCKIRHPNYLGEIIFHIGFYGSMASATNQVFPLVLGGFGTGWIILLMIEEARIHDRKHEKTYGDTQDFAEYRKTTGSLLPRLF